MVSRQPPALENSLFVLAAEATPDDQQSLLGRLARRGVDTAEADGAGDAAAMLENAFSLGERMPDIVIASGNDEQEVRRLRARLLKISDESRPKLCIVSDFGSEPLF